MSTIGQFGVSLTSPASVHASFEDSLSDAHSDYLSIEMTHEMAEDEPVHMR